MNLNLCVHKMNPVSCPTCFRIKPVQKAAAPHINPMLQQGQTIDIGEATMRATQRSALMQRPQAVMPNGQVREFKEPYRTASGHPPPEAHSTNKVWEPPVRTEIIDLQPTHPHLDASQAKVLKA